MLLLLLILAEVHIDQGWHTNLSDHDLFRSRSLAVAPDGTVATIDRDAANVMLLDKDGKFMKRFGIKGQGPGELWSPTEIVWSNPDKAFVIMDFGNSRLSLWSPIGKFIKEYAFAGRALVPRIPNLEAMFLASNMGAMNPGPAQLVRWDRKSSDKKVLWEYDPPNKAFTNAGSEENPMRVLFRWDPQLVYDMGSDFLAVSFGNQETIEIMDLDGKKTGTIKVALERYPVSDAQIEEGFGHLPANFHEGLRRGLVKPDTWPHLRALRPNLGHRRLPRRRQTPPFPSLQPARQTTGRRQSPRSTATNHRPGHLLPGQRRKRRTMARRGLAPDRISRRLQLKKCSERNVE